MLAEWLEPLLQWLGIGLVPFIMILVLIVVCVKG